MVVQTSVVAVGTPAIAAAMACQHKVADLILEGNFFCTNECKKQHVNIRNSNTSVAEQLTE